MLAPLLASISWILTLLLLDGIMIYFVILPMFKKYIPTYLNTDMNFIAAIAFYLLYILVLLLLVVIPWVEWRWTLLQIVQKSALFGFWAYMTYELTSMSVMKGVELEYGSYRYDVGNPPHCYYRYSDVLYSYEI